VGYRDPTRGPPSPVPAAASANRTAQGNSGGASVVPPTGPRGVNRLTANARPPAARRSDNLLKSQNRLPYEKW